MEHFVHGMHCDFLIHLSKLNLISHFFELPCYLIFAFLTSYLTLLFILVIRIQFCLLDIKFLKQGLCVIYFYNSRDV